MPDLTTNYLGLTLKNPIIVGSAGITATVELISRAADAGAAAVVMKSLGDRTWESPRFAVLKRKGDSATTTFYSVEGNSKFDEQRYAEEVATAKARTGIPIIASLACFNDEDWVRRSQLLEQAGADALEADISCPHGAHVLISENSVSEVGRVTRLVKSHISIPFIPKLAPQATDPVAVAMEAEGAGADAVTAFNRFTGLDVDIDTQAPILHGGLAGHGGPWAIYYALRWISALYPRLRIPISASGGVFSAEDVVKMLLVGATTVQTVTSVILGGYGIVTLMVRGLERYLEQKGHQSVDEFRGLAARRLQPAAVIDRGRSYRAEIDANVCTECAQCANVCICGAPVRAPEGGYRIGDSCAGCGLCADLCRYQAITIHEIEANR